jgi:pimeloyl-ACP methyl ester carboxylesterase
VLQRGTGFPIVLIHGAITTHRDWLGGPMEGFVARGRVLAVDRPGHGKSRRPRFEASPLEQARQIRRGLDALGVQRPLIVGHSFGGLTAMAYAAEFPQDLSGLLLLAPVGFPEVRPVEHAVFAPRALPITGPMLNEAARLHDPVTLRILQQVQFSPQHVPIEWLRRFPWEDVLSREAMVNEGEDTVAILPTQPRAYANLDAIVAPTIIVSGTADRIAIPVRHAKPLARRIKGSRLILLPGLGHMIHHCATAEILAAADELLERGLT